MSTSFLDPSTNNSTIKTFGKTIKTEYYEISEKENNKGKFVEGENESTLKSEQPILKMKKTRKNGRINFPVELVRNSENVSKLFLDSVFYNLPFSSFIDYFSPLSFNFP